MDVRPPSVGSDGSFAAASAPPAELVPLPNTVEGGSSGSGGPSGGVGLVAPGGSVGSGGAVVLGLVAPVAPGGSVGSGGAVVPIDGAEGKKKFGRVLPGERSEPWGIWTIAEIVTKHVHTGYGVTCGQHHDEGLAAQCKRQLAFGTRRPLSPSETRRRLKAWLLAGVDIASDHLAGKTAHFVILPRDIDPLPSEADLDAQAAVVAAAYA